MTKTNKAAAAAAAGVETSSEARLKAFREKMKALGMIGGGKDYLSIDVDGGFLFGKWMASYEIQGKKYKNMETHHTIEVSEGFGRTKSGIGEVTPGVYDVRAGGQVDSFIKKREYKAGDTIGAYFKGKQEPSKDFPKGVKSYEMFAPEMFDLEMFAPEE